MPKTFGKPRHIPVPSSSLDCTMQFYILLWCGLFSPLKRYSSTESSLGVTQNIAWLYCLHFFFLYKIEFFHLAITQDRSFEFLYVLFSLCFYFHFAVANMAPFVTRPRFDSWIGRGLQSDRKITIHFILIHETSVSLLHSLLIIHLIDMDDSAIILTEVNAEPSF